MASRRRPPDPPPLEIRRFTPDDADRKIKLLEARIGEVRGLDPNQIPYNDERVRSAAQKISSTVLEVFGERSLEFEHHRYYEISGGRSVRGVGYGEDPRYYDAERQQDFAEGIPRAITMLEGLIGTVRERTDSPRPAPGRMTEMGPSTASREVFIVHGHAEHPREAVATFGSSCS